jgi:hypothetical protein
VPTSRGLHRLRMRRTGISGMPVTGPPYPAGTRWEWDSTCCPGLSQNGRACESSRHDR